MRKNLLTIPVSAILMISCGGKGTNENHDSTTMTDTDTVLIEPIANENHVDTGSMPTYYSEDLKRFGLNGKVKTVKTNNYSPFVSCLASPLTFNEEGVLTSLFSEFTDNEINYNSDGFIDKTRCRESDGTTFELKFIDFDTDMNPVSGKYKSDGPDEIWEVQFTITYTNFDHERNWTQRTFKGESVSRYVNEDGEYTNPQKEAFEASETRTIVYYR